MKVSELMKGITPDPTFEGFATNDDFVLAVKTEADQTTPNDYTVVQLGVTGHEGSLNPETSDNQYIRTGKVTTKTGVQRKFAISGDRYEGDDFQDYCMSHKIKFGHGQEVVTDYVYFSMLTGKGEKGKVTVIVNEDQTGEAGSNAGFSVDLTGTHTPTEYTYTATA
ncbi:MAG: phage tail tube protein [Gemmiger sp.]